MSMGFIRLNRRIEDHWLYNEPSKKFSKFEAWLFMLFRANYKEGNKVVIDNKVITQKRGEFITSQISLANKWNWNVKTVKRFLEILKRENMIAYEADNNYTKIFIINYDKYNPVISNDGQQKGGQKGQEADSREEIKGGLIPTINKDNNENKVNNLFNSPEKVMREFIGSLEKQEEIIQVLKSKGLNEEKARYQIKKFLNYWTEPTKSGKKQRWETEKTFELSRRLVTWFNNAEKFNNNYGGNTPKAIRI